MISVLHEELQHFDRLRKINIKDKIQNPIFPHYWHYEIKDRNINIDKQTKQVSATYVTIKIL